MGMFLGYILFLGLFFGISTGLYFAFRAIKLM